MVPKSQRLLEPRKVWHLRSHFYFILVTINIQLYAQIIFLKFLLIDALLKLHNYKTFLYIFLLSLDRLS